MSHIIEDDERLAVLSQDIYQFLEEHAKIAGDYDPDYDEYDERFTGPDPVELLMVARRIEQGEDFRYPHSEFGSGCYDYTPEVRQKHDALMERIKAEI